MSWVTSSVAIPRRASRSSSSARICAWIVTSSAVVGSSAISTLRLAGERDRDHHALAQAAGELMWDSRSGARGAGAGRPARAPRARARSPPACEAPRCRRTGSATCSPIVFVGFSEDCESWKIIATSLPRMRRSSASGSPTSSRPSSRIEPSTIVAAAWAAAEDREPEHRLAAAGLAHQPERLARLDPQIDVADGVDDRAATA